MHDFELNGAEKTPDVVVKNGAKLNPENNGDIPSEVTITDKDKKKEKQSSVSYVSLYRFADGFDLLLIIIGTIAAAAHGAGLPLMFLLFGKLTDDFTEYGIYETCDFSYDTCKAEGIYNETEADFNSTIATAQNLTDNAIDIVYYFVYLACGVFVCASIQVSTWSLQAVRQSKRIRVEYFRAIMRQDMAFHDKNPSGELNARLADDIKKIHDGIADKVAICIQYSSMTISGLIIAFIYAWKLALVTLAAAPFLGISSSLMFMVSTKFTKRELDSYSKAGGIAEETISAIRTVVAFGCQSKEVERYSSNLNDARVVGMKKGTASGASIGFLYFTMFSMYALSFWYGTILVIDGEITVGDMMTTFFGVLIAAFALGSVGGNFEYFSAASSAAYNIFNTIDRVPSIDIFSNKGEKPKDVQGQVEFKNVKFSYPTRADVEILSDVSLNVEVGKTVALVGQSGCGKSTCMQLIQRFYDTLGGSVKIDNIDVRDYNLNHLRNNIGIVAQEPVLFATSIRENIRWGRDGVSDDAIVKASKEANAYDFIMKLPKKFETLVGEGGGQLSGGQKQRIAIARAIVRNPKVMLLDEATSALDTESESIVQSALEKASQGRTTIVIAHRLSTIINSDKIIAFVDGKVMEEGSHEELLKIPNGVYANLVSMQMVSKDVDEVNIGNEKEAKSKASIRKRTISVKSNDVARKEDSVIIADGEEENEEQKEEVFPPVSATRILQENKPEWTYIGFGCIFAGMAGCVDPLNALIFSKILLIFTIPDEAQQRSDAVFYAGMFLVLGSIAMIAYTIEAALFAKAGMELTTRLRKKTFNAMLRQDISYFDDHRHGTGALCTRLATDASRVQGASGIRMGTIIKNCCTMIAALGLSFAFGWQLTLVTLAFVPFLAIGGYFEMQLLLGEATGEKKAYEGAGRIASEATINVRTVKSLTREHTLLQMYEKNLQEPLKNARKKAVISGIGYGYSQCVIYFAYAAVFRYGLYLVEVNAMGFEDVFLVLTAVIFGAMAIGQNSSFAPDFAEAQVSSYRIFFLIDNKPEIDAYDPDGLQPSKCDGEVKFQNVEFCYPTRPDMLVLKDCTYEVKKGMTVALVGQSGCGKSTCVQLIERFYDAANGKITIDDCSIKDLNVNWLRQQIGIVSQEPLLFNQTIKENILYGDIANPHTDEEVIQCAKEANIHEFINSLPLKYETNVGAKGSQLSGGQKQRVAIARALLRNPKILLLDEATSALDAESEKVVQEALDKARLGRTSIVIAHRLTTIKDADLICVVDNGSIVESGTHNELIAKNAAYFSLVNAQLSKSN